MEKWNPKGNSIQFDFRASEEERAEIIKKLIAEAKETLPPGTLFEIRELPDPKYRLVVDYGRKTISYDEACKNHGMAWIAEISANDEDIDNVNKPGLATVVMRLKA